MMFDDFDQLYVLQNRALRKYRMGDFYLVIGKRLNKVAWGVHLACHPFSQLLADLHFDVMNELAQNIGHDVPFCVPQDGIGVEEQIADDLNKTRAPFDRLVARQSD